MNRDDTITTKIMGVGLTDHEGAEFLLLREVCGATSGLPSDPVLALREIFEDRARPCRFGRLLQLTNKMDPLCNEYRGTPSKMATEKVAFLARSTGKIDPSLNPSGDEAAFTYRVIEPHGNMASMLVTYEASYRHESWPPGAFMQGRRHAKLLIEPIQKDLEVWADVAATPGFIEHVFSGDV